MVYDIRFKQKISARNLHIIMILQQYRAQNTEYVHYID